MTQNESPRFGYGFYVWLLIIASVIWGFGFIAQKYSLENGMPGSLIMALRMGIGSLIMLAVFFRRIREVEKKDIYNGFIAGLLIGGGGVLQILGLKYTTVSSNSFLVAAYIIVVPFISWIFLKKPPSRITIVYVITGFVGVCFLTRVFETDIEFNFGDLLTLISMVLFAGHIVYVAHSVREGDATKFTFWELLFAGLVALVFFALFERRISVGPEAVPGVIIALAYIAVMCGFIAFWLQNIAQQYVHPSRTALIFTLEAVTASVSSIALGMEQLGWPLVLGAAFIVIAIALSSRDLKYA